MTNAERVRLLDIHPRSWEHPADRAALRAAKSLPGFDTVIQKIVGLTGEKWLRLQYLGSAVRVNENQFAELYTMYRDVCDILSVHERPELFVSNNPLYNAGAIGVDKPFIVLNSAVVTSSRPGELRHILGHELGHCLSGHVLYLTVLHILMSLMRYLFVIPGVGIANIGIVLALLEWQRKAELTADRAGLLVTQDTDQSYRSLMKLAGGADTDKMNINEFFVQAAEYEAVDSLLDSSYKLFQLVGQTHPFPVLRLAELKTWVDTGAYNDILNGKYIFRSDKVEDDFMDDVNAASEQYRRSFTDSSDPLSKAFAGIYSMTDSAVDSVSGAARDLFNSIFGSGEKKNGNEERQ